MRMAGTAQASSVDGPGLRFVIFTQGCLHRCPHCHNPDSWDVNGGEEISVKQVVRMLKKQKKNLRGVTFSGGEPFLQAAELAEIAQAAHEIDLDVVTYTGFTYEELEQIIMDNNDNVRALISASDILIDGRYIHELRNEKLQFRGSSNQRIIDVSGTQKSGRIVLWNEKENPLDSTPATVV